METHIRTIDKIVLCSSVVLERKTYSSYWANPTIGCNGRPSDRQQHCLHLTRRCAGLPSGRILYYSKPIQWQRCCVGRKATEMKFMKGYYAWFERLINDNIRQGGRVLLCKKKLISYFEDNMWIEWITVEPIRKCCVYTLKGQRDTEKRI